MHPIRIHLLTDSSKLNRSDLRRGGGQCAARRLTLNKPADDGWGEESAQGPSVEGWGRNS